METATPSKILNVSTNICDTLIASESVTKDAALEIVKIQQTVEAEHHRISMEYEKEIDRLKQELSLYQSMTAKLSTVEEGFERMMSLQDVYMNEMRTMVGKIEAKCDALETRITSKKRFN